MKKFPWGIIASICAQMVLYLTLGVVLVFVVLNKIAQQTNDTTTIFGTWYQTLMFVLDVVFLIGTIFSLFMFIKKKMGGKNELKKDF